MAMSKYHAKKTVIDGHKFDSKLEAKRYLELKEMQKKGEIYNLVLQPSFELIPTFRKNGKTYRKTTYRADFSYFETASGEMVVEDTKGFKTDVYKLKKKMFEHKYPTLEIKEVTK